MVVEWCRADGRTLAVGFYLRSPMEDVGKKTQGYIWLREMPDERVECKAH